MTRAILLGVVVAAVVAGVIWWARGQGDGGDAQRPERSRLRTDDEARLVLMAFGGEWAKRFGCTEDELSSAFMAKAGSTGTRAGTPLAERVSAEVGVVDLRFDQADGNRGVAVTILLTYSGSRARSTAHLTLAWDDVPGSVRADLLRGGAPVFRKWRAAA
jgi:hypothetical protein